MLQNSNTSHLLILKHACNVIKFISQINLVLFVSLGAFKGNSDEI